MKADARRTTRKFHEIRVMHASPTTTGALARIGTLYAIEDEIRGKPAALKLSIRQAEPIGAIRYALSRWRSLSELFCPRATGRSARSSPLLSISNKPSSVYRLSYSLVLTTAGTRLGYVKLDRFGQTQQSGSGTLSTQHSHPNR
jgi:hypothetical protein